MGTMLTDSKPIKYKNYHKNNSNTFRSVSNSDGLSVSTIAPLQFDLKRDIIIEKRYH